MFSEINHEEASEILMEGWNSYLNGDEKFDDNPYRPNDPYTKKTQDKIVIWRRGYELSSEVDGNLN